MPFTVDFFENDDNHKPILEAFSDTTPLPIPAIGSVVLHDRFYDDGRPPVKRWTVTAVLHRYDGQRENIHHFAMVFLKAKLD